MATAKSDVMRHIRKHAKYPSSKKALVSACAGMSDVAKADKEWLEEKLPNRVYYAADQVVNVLRLRLLQKRVRPAARGIANITSIKQSESSPN